MEIFSDGKNYTQGKNKAAQNMCNSSQHRSNTQMNKIVHEIDAVRAESQHEFSATCKTSHFEQIKSVE